VIQPVEQRGRRVAMMFSCVPFKASADGIKALEIAKQQFPDLQVILFGTSRRRPSIPVWMTYLNDPPQQHLVENVLNTSSVVCRRASRKVSACRLPKAQPAAAPWLQRTAEVSAILSFMVKLVCFHLQATRKHWRAACASFT